MSIFKEEFLKFQIELKAISKKLQFSLINTSEILFRIILRFIFFTITAAVILGFFLTTTYFIFKYFQWTDSPSDFALIAIIFIVIGILCYLIYLSGDFESTYPVGAVVDLEIESLKTQKEILITQQRIAASNTQMEFQSWIKRNDRID